MDSITALTNYCDSVKAERPKFTFAHNAQKCNSWLSSVSVLGCIFTGDGKSKRESMHSACAEANKCLHIVPKANFTTKDDFEFYKEHQEEMKFEVTTDDGVDFRVRASSSVFAVIAIYKCKKDNLIMSFIFATSYINRRITIEQFNGLFFIF
ncbi:hypothetical protein [Shahe hepe-like virus 2]|uniref:hypothetical protein n=1 Tax=Shahe hepe-like virus 2 TaxID=1923416 RepID=UPI00090B9AA7|nr:hypothetical protein [Shahe hepe-like virus 2]APG77720.1 hypothetical protein [Shahe hepe-like virus 2]